MSETIAPTGDVVTPETGATAQPTGDQPQQSQPERVSTPQQTEALSQQVQGDGALKALQAERDRAKKAERDLRAMQSRLQEFEDRDKTEAQRQSEALARAQRDAETAQAEMARLRIAMRHGIPEEDFDLLGSGDEETLNARAERLAAKNLAVAAQLAATQQPASPNRRPTEDLKPGATPVDQIPITDDTYPAGWLPGI